MKIGITGTRQGMTTYQLSELKNRLGGGTITEAHHGDCIGADSQFHDAVLDFDPKAEIIIHPPNQNKYRAFCNFGTVLKTRNYLKRNRDIVHCSDLLMVFPRETQILPKGTRGSGTWYTYHYAQDQGVKTLIVWPDGTVA